MKTNSMGVTNLKISAKMHLFIIISCVIIALGMAVGTVCHFVSNGFYNYSGDYESYKSVTVNYEDIDFSGSGKKPVELISDICAQAFKNQGISDHVVGAGDTNTGGFIEYKFLYGTSDEKLAAAVDAINAEIKNEVVDAGGMQFSYASRHTSEALLGGGVALTRASITIATIIVFHFLYFVVRYKLTMALGALVADVHNLALFLSLTALLRVPTASSIAVYAVITVLATVVGTCFLFDRMRKSLKDESVKKLAAREFADKAANESLKLNLIMPACLAALSVVLFVLLSISSLSPLAILAPVACALVAFAVCAYGTALFAPAVYSGFKALGDKMKSNTDKKSK